MPKGVIVGVFKQPTKEGSVQKWNVMIQNEAGAKGYLTFNASLAEMQGKEIEFVEEAPKFGTTPILKLATSSNLGHPGAFKGQSGAGQGRNSSFACSYSKDIVIALMAKESGQITKEQVDALLDHYFKIFLSMLKQE